MILGEEPIGEAISQWRTNLGLNIAQAAQLAGIPASVWGRIESGKTPSPYWGTIIKMFHVLGVQVEVKLAATTPRQEALDASLTANHMG